MCLKFATAKNAFRHYRYSSFKETLTFSLLVPLRVQLPGKPLDCLRSRSLWLALYVAACLLLFTKHKDDTILKL